MTAATPLLPPADWRDFLALTKPRVVALMLFTVVVGMLLAARDERRRDADCLVASVDSRVARLWLRLGIGGPAAAPAADELAERRPA